MADLVKLGVFQQPSYISIGDEYDKPNRASDRHKGVSFSTAQGKKGQGADIGFTKEFKSLHEGDKFVDPGTHEKKYRLEQEKKKITPEGFRYTAPSKKPCGSGSWQGCFTTAPQHQTEFDVLQKGELPSKTSTLSKNILTNPAKKGTFGTPGTNIGGKQGTEFKYTSDPYDAEHRKELSEARNAAKKIAGNGPFKSACRRTACFDENGTTGASKVFSLDRALPPKKSAMESRKPGAVKPFKPSSPGKKGYDCTINKFPEYKEDPLELQERRKRAEAKQNMSSFPQIWKPISGTKSTPCRSVALSA